MPAFARKSPEADKKKAFEAEIPKNWKKQTLPKSINHVTRKYPSLPGVEGARLDPRAKPARGTPPEASDEKERKLHPF